LTLLSHLDLPKERHRLKANAAMGVEGFPGVWALGDCAVIPDEKGGYQPPTAQHASREGKRSCVSLSILGPPASSKKSLSIRFTV
jgi:NADH dehydrogenase FAD-containing subunit